LANFGTDNVSVLLGRGDGTFQPAVNYAAGGGCQSVAAGDFNGDGRLDVAFSPSTVGTLNGTLAVTDNAAGSPPDGGAHRDVCWSGLHS
jgi:hypothetical protein